MNERKYNVSYPGWDVIRLIGSGSYGDVYEIQRDLQGKREKAALKVITIPQNESAVEELQASGYSEESITAHFKGYLSDIVREYTLLAGLGGRTNLVCCYDVRQVQKDDGFGWEIYIRMELLTPMLKAIGVHMPEEEIIKLGKDLCTALTICRRHNILHRDIKPQNIMVSQDGDYKLGDFGIAKIAEKTSGGTKIGTPNYMAPEVYNNDPYGHLADIYSLGMVLYWLLNDRRFPFLPLPPAVPGVSEMEEARERRFRGEPLPPPVHGNEKLKRAVLKACAYDPKDRFQTAEEMLRALEKAMPEPENAVAEEPTILEKLPPEEKTALKEEKPPVKEEAGNKEKGGQADPGSGAPVSGEKAPGKALIGGEFFILSEGAVDEKQGIKHLVVQNESGSITYETVAFFPLPDEAVPAFQERVKSSLPELTKTRPLIRLIDEGSCQYALLGKEEKKENKRKLKPDKKKKTKPGEKKHRGIILLAAAAVLAVLAVILLSPSKLTIAGKEVDKDASSLTFHDVSFTEDDIKNLSRMKHLTSFSAESCAFPGSAYGAMRTVIERVEKIALVDCDDSILMPTDAPELKELDLSGTQADSLSNISGYKTLKELNISGCERQTEYLDLSAFEGLTSLDCSGTPLTSSFLEKLPKTESFTSFSAIGSQLSDDALKTIGQLESLTELRLDNNSITNIEPLSGMTGLEILSLNNNQITDLSPLNAMIYLKELRLGGNGLADLSPLSNCTRLETVQLNDNALTDINVLEKSVAYIKNLYISGNQISDVSLLSQAAALEFLDADYNLIRDLSSVSALPNLQGVSAAYNDLAALEFSKSEVRSLAYLDVHGNPLTDLVISSCRNLSYLDISDSLLGDLIMPLLNNNGVTLLASRVPLETIEFNTDGQSKNDFSWLLLDGNPKLFSSSLDMGLEGVKGEHLAFSYDSAWGRTSAMSGWNFYSYAAVSPSLDSVRDLEDALGENKVKIYDDPAELYAEAAREASMDIPAYLQAKEAVTKVTRVDRQVEPMPEAAPEQAAEPAPDSEPAADMAPAADPVRQVIDSRYPFLGEVPSGADLDYLKKETGTNITRPKEDEYLNSYELRAVQAENENGSIFYFWAPEAVAEKRMERAVGDGTELVVIGRRDTMLCVTFLFEGEYKYGWVSEQLTEQIQP